MAIDPHKAAAAGNVERLKSFVRAGGDVNSRGTGQLERTPLHIAIEQRQMAACHLLIELGADVNAEDYRKCTPLHYAAGMGLVEVVELLLRIGADARRKDTFGETAIHHVAQGGGVASKRNQIRIVELLTAAGLDADEPGNAGRTPLWYAAARGKSLLVEALLDAGADRNRRAAGELGTPRDAATGDAAKFFSTRRDSRPNV